MPIILLLLSSCNSSITESAFANSARSKSHTPTPSPTATPVPTATPSSTPSNSWTSCATEGGTCNFMGTRQILYGVSLTSQNIIMTFAGGATCDNNTFGDPAPGFAKSCWYGNTLISPSPTPAPTATPASTATPTPSPYPAGSYFVDPTNGNDLNAGTSETTAWKTLAKVNATSFAPGNSILFKRGETFYGSLVVNQSGTAGSPITFGAYGTSTAKPVISGFTTMTSWTSLGGGIYQAACPNCQTTANLVSLNGVNTAMGRWPNAGTANKGYRTITSAAANTSITDTSLAAASAINWTGAEVVIRKWHWVLDRNLITSEANGVINYNSITSNDAQAGYGYFIQNDPRTLDVFGEWYFNPSTKNLQMFFGSAGPGTNLVQVSSVDTLATVIGRAYITFDGLSLQGSNSKTFSIGSSSDVTIQNSDIRFSGRNAIWGGNNYGTNSNGFKLINSTISDTNNNAITLANEYVAPSILSNTIKNTGMLEGMGDPGDGNQSGYKGITLDRVNNVVIKYNNILNTGYVGINFSGNNILIQNNFISSFCNVTDDGGGIYTYAGTTDLGNKVLNNIVMNGTGAGAGTADNQLSAQGIYMDDLTANVEVAGNTMANNAYAGLFLHRNHDMNIHDNTLYNNTREQVTFDAESSTSTTRNMAMNNNIFFARDASQFTATLETYFDDIALFGTFDNNTYARPIDDNLTIRTMINGWSAFTNRSLAGWQAYVSQDLHSHKAPKTITNVSDIRFEYNATNVSVTIPLDVNYMSVDGVNHSGSITLLPYTSIILIKN